MVTKKLGLAGLLGLGVLCLGISAASLQVRSQKSQLFKQQREVDWQKFKDARVVAVLKRNTIKGTAVESASSESGSSASASSERVVVVVDGIIMELPKSVVEAWVRNGTFIPVWAGTTEELPEDRWPCWLNPNCPD